MCSLFLQYNIYCNIFVYKIYLPHTFTLKQVQKTVVLKFKSTTCQNNVYVENFIVLFILM